jgi:dihydropteroate synthase
VKAISRPLFVLPLPDGRSLRLGERTLVMGVLNVTPDSFADGGRYMDPERAAAQAVSMERAGADIIDIGGESTRPGAEPLPEDEELRRVLPVLERLRSRVSVPISIDTYKAGVADAALSCGAAIVNDVSALEYDPELSAVVARRRAAVILMHTRGRSRDMYGLAQYVDVVGEVAGELGARLTAARESGIDASCIVLDPGIGFAKRAEHSGRLLAELHRLHALERPILVGPSRKSFLQRALGERTPAERDWATAAAVSASVFAGAHIVRVHAVGEMVDVVRVADALRRDAGLDGGTTGMGGTG